MLMLYLRYFFLKELCKTKMCPALTVLCALFSKCSEGRALHFNLG